MDEFWQGLAWVVFMFLGAIALVVGGNAVYQSTAFYKASKAAEQVQDAADSQPRVIREKDGCKVYAFKAGGYWHYFTRCPMETTTESTWAVPVRHGKVTTYERRSDVMVTTNTPAQK